MVFVERQSPFRFEVGCLDTLPSIQQLILNSHPNGWGSYQQGKMREAAISGGLVPDTPEGHERVEFVTEGEASFHWCIVQEIAGEAFKVWPSSLFSSGVTVLVPDPGGDQYRRGGSRRGYH